MRKNLDRELWVLLNRTRQSLVTVRNKDLNELNVSMSAAAVLRTVIKLGENATLKGLSEELHFARHSVRELVLRMEKDGLLKGHKKSNMRNATYIEITEKGKEIRQKSDAKGNIDYIFSFLTDEEKHALYNILTKLRSNSVKLLKGNIKDLFPPINRDLKRMPKK